MTSPEEIVEIETALELPDPYSGVTAHVSRALELLSDRIRPDYRNSIKESISAVEAMCRKITGPERATLAQALAVIERNVPLHKSLRDAYDKLYGYTSDEGGIRHSLIADANPTYEEAKFMLVACVAFVNYLKAKEAAVNAAAP